MLHAFSVNVQPDWHGQSLEAKVLSRLAYLWLFNKLPVVRSYFLVRLGCVGSLHVSALPFGKLMFGQN